MVSNWPLRWVKSCWGDFFGNIHLQHSKELVSQDYLSTVVHTSDIEQDNLNLNEVICPKLKDLEDEAVNSKEYTDRSKK